MLQPLLNGGTAGAADGAGITAFVLNETRTAALLQGNPDIRGTAPRWAVLGDIFDNENLARNASCFVLVIDSQREEAIGLGRKWARRRLGEQEAYVVSRGASGPGSARLTASPPPHRRRSSCGSWGCELTLASAFASASTWCSKSACSVVLTVRRGRGGLRGGPSRHACDRPRPAGRSA